MISNLESAIGEKLTHIVKSSSGRSWLLVFENSLCQLRASRGWGDDDEQIVDDEEFDYFNYSRKDLLESGAITEEWIKEKEERRLQMFALQEDRKAAQERIQYEFLKKKFEPKGS